MNLDLYSINDLKKNTNLENEKKKNYFRKIIFIN
jgi:hypothetical protein